KKRGAERSFPALSLTTTFAPARVVGNWTPGIFGLVSVPAAVPFARLMPNPATIDSGASLSPLKLAAETLANLAPTKSGTGFDGPPPGGGVKTVTFTLPWVAMSVAGIVAANCAALPNVVVRSELLKRTTELPAKLVPLTVSVNCWPPANENPGLRPVIVGAGGGCV